MGSMMPFVWVVIMIVFVGGTFLWRKRQMGALAGMEAKDAHARAGAVAQRMGLTIVSGDPGFNFYHTGRWQDLGKAMSRNVLSRPDRPDIEIRMQGQPGGRPVELIYIDRLRVKDNVLSREVHRWWDARLVVGVGAPFPDFEVVTRNPNEYCRPEPQLALAPQSFGDAMLDSQLMLKTGDARIGPVLADALRLLASLHYVHVIGQGGVLTFRCTEMAAMMLGDGEKILLSLDEAARSIEKAAAAYTARAATA